MDAVALMMLYWLKRRREIARRHVGQEQRRETFGEIHHLIQEVLEDEEKCLAYIRMKPSTFETLLQKISPYIEKRETNFRKPLSPKERLIITLRYLASGDSYVCISFHFRTGRTTVRLIVRETCIAIWKVLQKEVLPTPDQHLWRTVANDFHGRFQFPMCLGALDGKHIRVKKPNKSGWRYFNGKGFYSIVLLAVTDASGKFLVVDVGACGGDSDGTVLRRSEFGKRLLHDKLDIPYGDTFKPDSDTNITLPYVFVAGDNFPLKDNIMKPYPVRQLCHDKDKEVFNARLCRARESVENSFGRIAQVWRILLRQVEEHPEAVTDIIKAITILHNFLLIQEPDRPASKPADAEGEHVGATASERGSSNFCDIDACGRATKVGMKVRDSFMNYFTSEEGSLSVSGRQDDDCSVKLEQCE